MTSPPDLIDRIAEFIVGYRAAGREPTSMMIETGRAFPGSTVSEFAIALTRANRQHADGAPPPG